MGEALLRWNAIDFEDEAASRGMCATALRSFQEWQKHPQAQALRDTPPITLVKIADAPKHTFPGVAARPLSGVRVLDLTRVLAGPICGRTLAGEPPFVVVQVSS